MNLRKLLAGAGAALAISAGVGTSAGAATYTFAGSWYVGEGPWWQLEPTVLNALETAALLFGGSASDYAISTNGQDANDINFMAHVDGYGDSQYLFTAVAQDFKVDNGTPGYDFSGGTDYSAYVLDHSCSNRYGNMNEGCLTDQFGQNFAFRIQQDGGPGAIPEPATWALMIGGFGLAGSALRRRRPVVA